MPCGTLIRSSVHPKRKYKAVVVTELVAVVDVVAVLVPEVVTVVDVVTEVLVVRVVDVVAVLLVVMVVDVVSVLVSVDVGVVISQSENVPASIASIMSFVNARRLVHCPGVTAKYPNPGLDSTGACLLENSLSIVFHA